MKKIGDVMIALAGFLLCLWFVPFFIPSFFSSWNMGAGFGYIGVLFIFILPFSFIAIVFEIIGSLKNRNGETGGMPGLQVQHHLSGKEKIIVLIAILIIAYCVYRYVPWAN